MTEAERERRRQYRYRNGYNTSREQARRLAQAIRNTYRRIRKAYALGNFTWEAP